MLRRLGYPFLVALGAILAGFVVLGVAWDGAASVDFVQGQISYLLSGGAVGLALIIIGAALRALQVAGAASADGSAPATQAGSRCGWPRAAARAI